jgi:succinate dehydrogenase / fumarate reductase cytochrome b subunit
MTEQATRPVSPHLQIYYLPITMFTSITHRATGIVLAVGSIFLSFWLVAAAMGPGAFASVNGISSAWYGQVIMFLWTFALFYHLCNGIRHLFWDVGAGLDLKTARITGFAVLGLTVILTFCTWAAAELVWAFG